MDERVVVLNFSFFGFAKKSYHDQMMRVLVARTAGEEKAVQKTVIITSHSSSTHLKEKNASKELHSGW